MYQILTPKFRFGLFLSSNQKSFDVNVGEPLICFADSYEIKEDGSIAFYQTAQLRDDKKFKIPVLSFANKQWEACVFLDEESQYPVFQGDAPQTLDQQEPPEPEEEEEEEYTPPAITLNKPVQQEEKSSLDELDDMLGDNNEDEETEFLKNLAAVQNNPKEFKAMKIEWIEKSVKEYIKNKDLFNLQEMLSILSKDFKNEYFRIDAEDIIWTTANLIIDKMLLARKFADISQQKMLALILPGIMRRQWDGKMAPILEILEEREESQNTNAIDLAVWIVQNNFS